MGVGGETHVRRNKCVEWASVKKKSFKISVSSYKASEGIVCSIDPRDTTHEIKQRSFIHFFQFQRRSNRDKKKKETSSDVTIGKHNVDLEQGLIWFYIRQPLSSSIDRSNHNLYNWCLSPAQQIGRDSNPGGKVLRTSLSSALYSLPPPAPIKTFSILNIFLRGLKFYRSCIIARIGPFGFL